MKVFHVYQEIIAPVEIMLNQVVLWEGKPILKPAKIFRKWLQQPLLSKIAVGAV